jgi:hypothetical protein
MDDLGALRVSLESGNHPACESCSWSPAHGRAAFGWSCSTHGYHVDRPAGLLSLQLVQDPAGTTPDQTGKLCFVCNSANPSDRTAQASWELWRTAVLGVPHHGAPASRDGVDPLLERHFWMNSTMHGVAGDSPRAKQRPDALARCSMVLREVLERLAPKVLIVNGRQAETAFRLTGLALDTGGFPHRWSDRGAARVRGKSGPNGSTALKAFVTPHTSIRGVNFGAAKCFRPKETDAIVRRKAAECGVADAAEAFLARYRNDDHATDRGMRVLLSHWLDIGRAIREVAEA